MYRPVCMQEQMACLMMLMKARSDLQGPDPEHPAGDIRCAIFN